MFDSHLSYIAFVSALKNSQLPPDLEELIFNQATDQYIESCKLIIIELQNAQMSANRAEDFDEFYLELPDYDHITDEELNDIVFSIFEQLEEQDMLTSDVIDIESCNTNLIISRLNDLLKKDVDDQDDLQLN